MTKEQFKKFAKEEFGYEISFEKSDEPDTYESLFGSCKGCEHAPTTYEEYCLHTYVALMLTPIRQQNVSYSKKQRTAV